MEMILKNKTIKVILAGVLVIMMCIGLLMGIGSRAEAAECGSLILKVNPEIEIAYDKDGNVTGLTALNADGKKILDGYTDYQGKKSQTVIEELIDRISQQGYLETEIEGAGRDITVTVEKGSKLPDPQFLEKIISEIQGTTSGAALAGKIKIEGENHYGLSPYGDSDYGRHAQNGAANGTGNSAVNGANGNAAAGNVTNNTPADVNTVVTVPANGNGNGMKGNTDYDGYTDYDGDTDYCKNNSGSAAQTPATAPTTAPTPTAPSTSNTDYDSNTDYGHTDYDSATDYGSTDYDND